jgi:hypothetical protein
VKAALVDDGWMSPAMLVAIPPIPPPFLELEDEVGLEPIAVVVASTAEVTRPEVVTVGDEVLEMLSAHTSGAGGYLSLIISVILIS